MTAPTASITPAAALESPVNAIVLGLGEWAATGEPGTVLTCLGLGSCVAFAAYDPVSRIAGMAHMVLPDSSAGRGGGGKFVDIAIPLVLEEMKALGAVQQRIALSLVGGSHMLANRVSGEHGRIGERNIEAARAALASLGLEARAEDVGGTRGRTVKLDAGSGQLLVSHAGEAARALS